MVDRRLYVGRIPDCASKRDVKTFFNGYGDIQDIERRDGCCFVELEDNLIANDAVRDLNDSLMCGERVIVEHAHRRRRICYRSYPRYRRNAYWAEQQMDRSDRYRKPTRTKYQVTVGDFSSIRRVTWQKLKDFMSQYGEVTYAEVRGNTGIVEFATYDDMKRTIEELDDSYFLGVFITIRANRRRSSTRSRSHSWSFRYRPSRDRNHSSDSSSSSRSRSSSSSSSSNSSSSSSSSRSGSCTRMSSRRYHSRSPRRWGRCRFRRSHSRSRRHNFTRSFSRSRSPSYARSQSQSRQGRKRYQLPAQTNGRSYSKSLSRSRSGGQTNSQSGDCNNSHKPTSTPLADSGSMDQSVSNVHDSIDVTRNDTADNINREEMPDRAEVITVDDDQQMNVRSPCTMLTEMCI